MKAGEMQVLDAISRGTPFDRLPDATGFTRAICNEFVVALLASGAIDFSITRSGTDALHRGGHAAAGVTPAQRMLDLERRVVALEARLDSITGRATWCERCEVHHMEGAHSRAPAAKGST
jgi:hypothetical protein